MNEIVTYLLIKAKYDKNYISQLKYLEKDIAKSANNSLEYAIAILKAPFPLGEPIIAKSVHAIYYAQHVLDSRFKIAENKINLFKYIKNVMKFNHE